MWFIFRFIMYIKNLSVFVYLKIYFLMLYYKYKCLWVRGMYMVIYNFCVIILNIEYK